MDKKDVILCFDLRCKQEFPWHRIIERFLIRLPPVTTARKYQKRQALEHVICEAVIAARRRAKVSYSRRTEFYPGRQRYHGESFTYRNVVPMVDLAIQHGLLEGDKARPGDHLRTQRQSTFTATDGLLELFEGLTFKRVQHETIRLKDEDKRLIPYRDTAETVRMRNELAAINSFLATVRIGLPEHVQRTGPYTIDDSGERVFEPVQLYRVFSRGSFDLYGRVHGWHQNLERYDRRLMTLNGHPVVEVDYRSMHTTMLFAEQGIQLTDDPYDQWIFPREMWKRGINICLNNKTIRKAFGTLLGEFQLGKKMTWFFIRLICYQLPELKKSLGSDAGVRLMRKDSEMIINAMNKLIAQGVIIYFTNHPLRVRVPAVGGSDGGFEGLADRAVDRIGRVGDPRSCHPASRPSLDRLCHPCGIAAERLLPRPDQTGWHAGALGASF